MLPSEKLACVRLLKTENNDQSGCDSDESNTYLFSMKKIKNTNKRKLEAQDFKKSDYICCDFIGSSAAIVENIWIKADALTTKRLKVMSPIMLEVIIYLKENSHLWNKMDVVMDYSTAR